LGELWFAAGELLKAIALDALLPKFDPDAGQLAWRIVMRFVLWKIRSGLQSLIQQEEGQDLVEYALVILLIAVALATALGNVGSALLGYYQYIVAKFP
jgi:Flp pilus assembly pilin Flp